MDAYGISPKRIDYGKDINFAANLMSKEYFKERELLVVDKQNRVKGCINLTHLLYLLHDGELYLRNPYLLPVKVGYENALYKDEILKIAKKGRLVFVIEENTNLGRLRKNIKIGSVLSEIPRTFAFEMAFDLKIATKDYSGSLDVHKVLGKKKKTK